MKKNIMNMSLIHYSKYPLKHLDNRETIINDICSKYECLYLKPYGLWLSVDDSWEKWCISESFRIDSLKYKHDVKLSKNANILKISSTEEVDDFNYEYSFNSGEYLSLNRMLINWDRVYEDYDGIIISPYNYGMIRYIYMWYYAWDCESGCIWNIDIIESIKLLNCYDVLKIKDAADFLGVCEGTLRNWDKQGKLKAQRDPDNGYRLYNRKDLENFLEENFKHGIVK